MLTPGAKVHVLDAKTGEILWTGTFKYFCYEHWAGVAFSWADPATARLGNGTLDHIEVARLRRA